MIVTIAIIAATLRTTKSWKNMFKVALGLCIFWKYLAMTTTLTTRKVGKIFVKVVVLITPNIGGN